ncbi:MAG: hypothetical protein CVV45_00690 [Spirochaetae bacterium HGW-Spirochaetae-10]|nr:MAG: hypothetical protein CVV45_00690 [Spirochaetae bacterium HGW-Spirochaetae-10]
MTVLPLPPFSVSDVIACGLSSVTDAGRQASLAGLVPCLLAAENAYKYEAARENLEGLLASSHISQCGACPEVEWYYTHKVADRRGAARGYYDAIKAAAQVCPICGDPEVDQLDHFLDKGSYPVFAATPCNLVPVCQACNFQKHRQAVTMGERQLFQPYFEALPGFVWLEAEVSIDPLAVKSYYVSIGAPDDAQPIKERLTHWMTTYGLFRRFLLRGQEDLVQLQDQSKTVGKALGTSQLMQICRSMEKRISATRGPNHWRTALYRGIIRAYRSADAAPPTLGASP